MAPIVARIDAAVAWTGTQMLVWGGGDGVPDADGAAYMPATHRWQVLPAAPISGRSSPAYTWTGAQLFVFGGYSNTTDGHVAAPATGALFTPATRAWAVLPPAPISACANGQAVDVGVDVFIVGCEAAVTTRSATSPILEFDIASSHWSTVAASPRLPGSVATQSAAAANGALYLFETWMKSSRRGTNPAGTQTTSGAAIARLDIRTGAWSADSPTGGGAGISVQDVLTAGSNLIVPNVGNCPPDAPCAMQPLTSGVAAVLNTTTNAWSDTPGGSLGTQNVTSLWTGSALLQVNSGTEAEISTGGQPTAVTPGQAAAWAPGASRWTALPTAPDQAYGIAIVWTGHQLLEWGPMQSVASLAGNRSPVAGTTGLEFGP